MGPPREIDRGEGSFIQKPISPKNTQEKVEVQTEELSKPILTKESTVENQRDFNAKKRKEPEPVEVKTEKVSSVFLSITSDLKIDEAYEKNFQDAVKQLLKTEERRFLCGPNGLLKTNSNGRFELIYRCFSDQLFDGMKQLINDFQATQNDKSKTTSDDIATLAKSGYLLLRTHPIKLLPTPCPIAGGEYTRVCDFVALDKSTRLQMMKTDKKLERLLQYYVISKKEALLTPKLQTFCNNMFEWYIQQLLQNINDHSTAVLDFDFAMVPNDIHLNQVRENFKKNVHDFYDSLEKITKEHF